MRDRPDLVALSIGTAERVPALQRTLDALRAIPGPVPRLPTMVGGRGVTGRETTIAGADFVSGSLADADRYIAGLRDRQHGSRAS